MPELPEVALYLHALEPRVVGQPIEQVRVLSPSLLKSWDPPLREAEGRKVEGLSNIGKRFVFELEGGVFLVVHLMVTGRFRWKEQPRAKVPGRIGHAALDFPHGTLLITEAGKKKRASLWLVRGAEALAAHDRGGIDPITTTHTRFREALLRENRTLKRALTDPRILSGIGNAHSDEILHRAGVSPVRRTRDLSDAEMLRLHDAARDELLEWIERLRAEAGDDFPEKVTAFHPAMAAHGKFGEPCPRCGTRIQRIVYAANETNYCPTCQTGGKLLADRALSRLLGSDWPRSVEDLEEMKEERRG